MSPADVAVVVEVSRRRWRRTAGGDGSMVLQATEVTASSWQGGRDRSQQVTEVIASSWQGGQWSLRWEFSCRGHRGPSVWHPVEMGKYPCMREQVRSAEGASLPGAAASDRQRHGQSG